MITLERQGQQSEAFVRRRPDVKGGVCDFHGIIDQNVPSEHQYKLCDHYRGIQLRCSYCPESKDPDEVIKRSRIQVAESPTQPGTWIAWCDSYECSRKHEQRFKRAA